MNSLTQILAGRRRRQRFERLLRPALDGLYRFACQLERDPVAAEDLVQHTLLVGLQKLDQLKEDPAFRSWMGRVMFRAWQNAAQRSSDVLLHPDELQRRRAALPARVQPDHALEGRRLGQELERAFDALPEAQRQAVWLVDGEGFRFSEAAHVLGLRVGTVASRVARGRAALRVELRHTAREQGVIP